MLRRPFAFWLPAFILAFLLWTWGLSCYQNFVLTHWSQDHDGGHSIELNFRASRLETRFSRSSWEKMSGHAISETRFVREDFPPDHYHWWFPLPGIEHRNESIPGIQSHLYRILIPCWLIVLLYLGLWRLAVRRYDRRTRRLRSKDHPSPAEPLVD